MAAVNEAWHVLGDPDRRRRYDAELSAAEHAARSSSDATSFSEAPTGPIAAPSATTYYERARFPWIFMAALASLGIGRPRGADDQGCVSLNERRTYAWQGVRLRAGGTSGW